MDLNNKALFTDFYELTMMQGYFNSDHKDELAIFDVFYRKNPFNGGYAIFAGLEQIVEYLTNLRFTDSDIAFLTSLNIFGEGFLRYLRDFKFTGSVYSVPEGTVIFPGEPLIKIIAPIMEGHLIEGAILNMVNHQCLTATKAARITQAAKNDPVLEFGLRRGHGLESALYGSRAAIIGGLHATSNVLAAKMFGVLHAGTHAHSWIMSFEDEISAFRVYGKLYPQNCIFLVDTYNTLKSGVPNAIKVFKELQESGVTLQKYGIRIDSGDISYLATESKKMLDAAGFYDALICASNDLDEYLITDLKLNQSAISIWGVGTNLISPKDTTSFGAVYKMAAKMEKDKLVPRIKLSDSLEKINNPGNKKIFRIYDKKTNKIRADLITLVDEEIDISKDLTIFDPVETWKKLTFKKGEFYTKELLVKIMHDGEVVYTFPSIAQIAQTCKKEKESLWSECKRFINPRKIPVDLSYKLYNLKNEILEEIYHLANMKQ